MPSIVGFSGSCYIYSAEYRNVDMVLLLPVVGDVGIIGVGRGCGGVVGGGGGGGGDGRGGAAAAVMAASVTCCSSACSLSTSTSPVG